MAMQPEKLWESELVVTQDYDPEFETATNLELAVSYHEGSCGSGIRLNGGERFKGTLIFFHTTF
jgi:hypothetical protein